MMNRTALTLVVLSASLLTLSPCFAAVDMPPDASGAKQEIPTQFLARDGRDWIVWVAYQRYRPKTRWSEQAPPEGFRYLKFMEDFRVLYHHQGDDGDYLLLGESDESGQQVERVVGWVREDCTVGPHALTVPGIRLHRKAMLVHRKLEREEPKATTGDETAEAENGGIEMEVDILDAPKKDATKRKSFKLFNIFFLYGSTNQGQYGIRDEEDYVLIGNAQQFKTEAWADGPFVEGSPENVIQGWVPASRLAHWNTREALEWDRPSTLRNATQRQGRPRRIVQGQIFSSAKRAKDCLDDPASGEESIGLFRELFDEHSESVPFKPHHMRYPILEWETEDLRLTAPGVDPPRYLPRKYKPPEYPPNELLKVGGIGGYGGLSKEQIEDLRNQLERVRVMISTSEILFVIDDTGSMDEYFDDVADVVSRITQNARRTTRTVRVAVAFYNDTDGRPYGTDPVVLLPVCFPLTMVRSYGRSMADIVKNHDPVSGGDPPELVFRGITEAIEGAQFSQYARKLVIVIGDCGDRLDNSETTTQEETIVNKLLPAGQSPIEFFAVQVCSADRDKYAKAFFRQMDNIVRLLNGRSTQDKRIKRMLGSYRNTKQAGLVELLNSRLRDLDRRAAEINLLLTSEGAGESSTEIGAEYIAILKDAGIDYENLKAQEGVQLFREGYTWRYAAGATRDVPQVRSRVMLDYATIEDIIRYMERLTGSRPGLQGGNITIEKALAQVVTAATGDPPDPKLSVEQQVFKRLGLVARSPLLKKPIGANHSPRLAYSEIFEIAHRVDLLKDILEGKQREWDKQEGTFAGEAVPKYVAIGAKEDFDRHFPLLGSTVKWYWIDMEEELP